MDLQKMVGFPIDQVRIDPDGASTPPEVSPLSPPTKPRGAKPDPGRLFEVTRIEGLAAPAPPPEQPLAAAPRAIAAPPPLPALAELPASAAAAPAPPAPIALTPPAAAAEAVPAALTPPVIATARREAAPLLRLQQLLRSGVESARAHERWVLIALCSTLIGFGAAVLMALLVRNHAAEASSPARSRAAGVRAAAAPVAAPASREACARQREAQLVTRGVASNFALDGRARSGGVDVLLGLSLGSGTALGLELNATTLGVTELLRDSAARELLGVVPTPSAGPPGFVVDRASVGGLRDWRTLPDRPELALTRTNRALNLTERATQRSTALWPIGAEEELSRPRLEWQDATQLALVLRRGGRQGKLVIAWFDPSSHQHSALRELPFAGTELGLPSLATQGNVAVVAAAVRESAAAPWHIELASSDVQGHSRRIELEAVALGAERDSFAPSLAALPDSRWFLQWTEGQHGLRRVRGLTLDAAFQPLGEPLVLSAPGASAGGGLISAVDQGLLSMFLVQRGSSYELWAATLSCR